MQHVLYIICYVRCMTYYLIENHMLYLHTLHLKYCIFYTPYHMIILNHHPCAPIPVIESEWGILSIDKSERRSESEGDNEITRRLPPSGTGPPLPPSNIKYSTKSIPTSKKAWIFDVFDRSLGCLITRPGSCNRGALNNAIGVLIKPRPEWFCTATMWSFIERLRVGAHGWWSSIIIWYRIDKK